MLPLLNSEQCEVFYQIWKSVSLELRHSFLDSAESCGKTFLYNTVYHQVYDNSLIVLCVVSCAIASLLLQSGHTAHSTFSIPVHSLAKDLTCQIEKKGV